MILLDEFGVGFVSHFPFWCICIFINVYNSLLMPVHWILMMVSAELTFPTQNGLVIHNKLWCKYNFLCNKCGKILKNRKGLLIHKIIWCGKTSKSNNNISLWTNLNEDAKLETVKYDKKRYGQKNA